MCTGFWWGDRWGDPGVDGRIMLGWIFKKWDVGVGTGFRLAQDRDRSRAIECGEGPSGSIKSGEFLD
jgi:hypothetical protein